MQHIAISARSQVGRGRVTACATPPKQSDPRWYALDLVRVCRQRLDLTDRDIAVLRGLMSLLPSGAWGGQMVVFASNKVLAARCDGIEERTLRRRLSHLAERGLIARKASPNGKRYQVKGAEGCVLAYGIDLAPLWQMLGHLEALADDCRRDEMRIRSFRALIRDALFHHPALAALPMGEAARLALRRKVSADDLQDLLANLQEEIGVMEPRPIVVEAKEMSATDSQNVRHIQSSIKENEESETSPTKPVQDITVGECMEAATAARALSPSLPRTWAEVAILARTLAPAIGLDAQMIRAADAKLGEYGAALAVLGLVEAFGRIRSPQAYLNALVKQAQNKGLDCVRMFWSLTQPKRAVA